MKFNLLKPLLYAGCLLLALNSCKKKNDATDPDPQTPPPTTPVHITNNYTLSWSDEFEGQNLDLTKWMYRGDGTVRNLGTVSRQTVSLDGNGNLLLKVLKDASGKYLIGQIATDGLFSARYGYFECRAKMNTSIGPHVAFWLQSNTMGIENNDPQNNGTEIDVFEYHRKSPETVFHNLHWNGYGTAHQTTGSKYKLTSVGTGYHVFGLEWNENEYIFYVDGVVTWKTNVAVSRVPEYLILTTELSGWGGDPDTGTFPDQVTYDYVRVYKKK